MRKEFLQQVNDLTKEIAKEFENELICRLPDIKYEYSNSDNLNIRIPSLNESFGDIKICIWCREIIVLIGDRFHTHFDIDVSPEDISNNNAKQVICEVVEFIEDVVNDKIFLRIKIRGNRVVSSGIVYENSINEPIKSMRVLSGFLGNIFLMKLKETKILLYSWSGIEKEVK